MTDGGLILKLFISMLPVALCCLILKRRNFSRADRYRQFFMPAVAIAFVTAACVGTGAIQSFVQFLITWFSGVLQSAAELSWVPLGLANSLSSASTSVSNLMDSGREALYIFFFTNIVIVLMFYIVKLIALRFMAKTVRDDGHTLRVLAGISYEYSTNESRWVLKEEYVQARSFLRAIYWIVFVLVLVLCVISEILYIGEYMNTLFYPVMSLILIGELYFFMDGNTKQELKDALYGEDEKALHQVNYTLLRKYLRKLFPDKLLNENTSISGDLSDNITNDEIVSLMADDDNQVISTFGEYLKKLDAEGMEIDYTYVKSTKDLLSGKSILFNNPFYNDLSPYIFYPMNRTVLRHKKVLVILGRHSIEDDIKEWIKAGIGDVTHIPEIWNIGVLDEHEQDLDIGIITRSDVYNLQVHEKYSEFLGQVEFVVVIEPSKLISTAQIGLNLLVNKINNGSEKHVTYCITDKNCDGLVDAISHVLQTSIIEVAATNRHNGTASYMCWEADDEYTQHRIVPNISRYLGFGTELSFAALKNQVAKTTWYGGETFPVVDIAWIARQYYYDLMKYADLPANQEIMGEHFKTSSNLWGSKAEDNSYLVVEDETFNMFEILREFSTRSKTQGFVNIISSEYLLKDYMSDNADIFVADSKAIPNLTADYVRSSRNISLRLILMMSTFPLGESYVHNELALLGVEIFNIRKQLWHEVYRCYSGVNEIMTLSENYETAVEEACSRKIKLMGYEFGIDVIETGEKLNFKLSRMEKTYLITDKRFISVCVKNLKSAAYIAEDEKGQASYLGSELTDQIYSKYLPGQFIVFGGKYYEMQYLTAGGKVLLRRAADHIAGRPSYRQIRNYTICGIRPSKQIGAYKDIAGFRISKEFADIIVETPGYYRMKKYNDFSTAKRIVFEGENNRIPDKQYLNKEILMIDFPECEGKFTDEVKYTITVLLNEVFRTLFDDNQAYISAVTDTSSIKDSIVPLTYYLKGDGYEPGKNAVYIIEDSQLDLGLLAAVERNIERIFQTVTDYLDWHFYAMDKSMNPREEDDEVVIVPNQPVKEEKTEEKPEKKKGFIERIRDKLGIGSGDNTADSIEPGEESTEIPVSEDGDDKNVHMDTGLLCCSSEESAGQDNVVVMEKEKTVKGVSAIQRKPYHLRHFLLYGGSDIPVHLKPHDALDYFRENGFDRNELKQARDNHDIVKRIAESYVPGKDGSRYCDFCGVELYGVEYETLVDGRDRCMNCGRTAVKSAEELVTLFNTVKNNMESFYGIRFKGGIKVEMVNAKKLHKKIGHTFVPTPKPDGRVLGVAIKERDGLTLMIENGSPRLSTIMTMAHEMTHIWQYQNWDQKEIKRKYGALELEIYEGMAKWVELQYAYNINEISVATREEIITSLRDDEYGRGFIRYRTQYPLSRSVALNDITPFGSTDNPLDSQYCGRIERTE